MLIQSAKELTDYSRSEEDKLGHLIQSVADSGATVVVAGAAIGEMAMHFIEKAGLMAIRWRPFRASDGCQPRRSSPGARIAASAFAPCP